MRPNRFSIGTCAYLVIAVAALPPNCTSAQNAQLRSARGASLESPTAQAPVVTRAAPIADPNMQLAQASQGQRARLSDNDSGASVKLSDQAWTGASPKPLPAVGSMPPLPNAAASLQTPGSSVVQAQYTANDSTLPNLPSSASSLPPSALPPPPNSSMRSTDGRSTDGRSTEGRSTGGKAMSLAGGQSSSNDTASESPGTRPLKPRSTNDLTAPASRSTSTVQMIVSVISSLLIVVALLLGAAWCYRKAAPKLSGTLPKEAVQVLGRTAIAPRQQLMVIRFGSKLLLVSNLQGEVRTLSEIDDALEVDRIAGICESAQSGSISHSFRTVLHNLGGTSE